MSSWQLMTTCVPAHQTLQVLSNFGRFYYECKVFLFKPDNNTFAAKQNTRNYLSCRGVGYMVHGVWLLITCLPSPICRHSSISNGISRLVNPAYPLRTRRQTKRRLAMVPKCGPCRRQEDIALHVYPTTTTSQQPSSTIYRL